MFQVRNGQTALHLACIGDGIEGPRVSGSPGDLSGLVKLLLEVGADPNLRDAGGNTSLHLAAKVCYTSFNPNFNTYATPY